MALTAEGEERLDDAEVGQSLDLWDETGKGHRKEQMLASARKAGIIVLGDSVEEADGRLEFDFARV